MAQDTTERLYSYDDYAAIDDDRRYEVIEGRLIEMTPAPTPLHQRLGIVLSAAFLAYEEQTGAGAVFGAPFDVVFRAERPATVTQPDVVWISRERGDRLTTANLQGAPDLAIEIFSPSTRRRDRTVKKRIYAQYGVRELWLVDPDRDTIVVHQLAADGVFGEPTTYAAGDMLTSPLLPGFTLDVARLFTRARGERPG